MILSRNLLTVIFFHIQFRHTHQRCALHCRFQRDLKWRKKAAENLNRRAVLNAIAETYVTTNDAATHKSGDAAAICTPGVAIAALSFNSMHDHGTVGVRRTGCSVVAMQRSCVRMHLHGYLRFQYQHLYYIGQ